MEGAPLFAFILDFLYNHKSNPHLLQWISRMIPVIPHLAAVLKKHYRIDPDEIDPSVKEKINWVMMVTSFLGFISLLYSVNQLEKVKDAYMKLNGGSADKGLRDYFNTVFMLLKAICQDKDLYPESWVSMHLFKEKTCLEWIKYAEDKLLSRVARTKSTTPDGDEEMKTWSLFMNLCVALIQGYQTYNRDEFPESVRKSWPDTPNIIIPIVQKECFPKIDRKTSFLSLLPDFLSLLSLSEQQKDIEKFVAELYYGIALCEFKQTGKFEKSAAMSCKTIDTIMTDRRKHKEDSVVISDRVFQQFFNDILGQFKLEKDRAVQKAGQDFTLNILNLLQLEMEYDAIPAGGDEERAGVTMKMMNYFMSFEMSGYFRYVHDLYILHLREDTTSGESVNYAEAGTTLLLHASRLGWTDEILPKLELQDQPSLPEEASWARKQRLYYQAIDAFNKAKLQERSIELLKELEVFHTMRRNFGQLKKILSDEKDAYCGIMVPSRRFSQYYLICYYGTGFSIVYSNKRFVYRADVNDTIETIAKRLEMKFPEAEIKLISDGSLNFVNPEELKRSEGQKIVLVHLEPSSQEEFNGKERVFPAKMPQILREYHRFNNTDVFVVSNPVDGKRTFFFSEERFPGTRRRLEVVKEVCK